jgi:hypothetical protein
MARNATYSDSAGRDHEGLVGFWGEWEGPSFARKIDSFCTDGPTLCHVPAFYEPASFEGLLDTDPFVFGDRFLYCGCQQHTCHHRAGGAVETFLRRLATGSLVLFGSAVSGRFVLDTALVVGDHTDYRNGDFGGLAGLVPDLYYPISLRPQWTGNQTCDSFRLYRGATRAESAGRMFSFTPCRPFALRGFARPQIVLPGVVTEGLTQGKKMTAAAGIGDVERAWDSVVGQVLSQGCSLAHRVELAPVSVAAGR